MSDIVEHPIPALEARGYVHLNAWGWRITGIVKNVDRVGTVHAYQKGHKILLVLDRHSRTTTGWRSTRVTYQSTLSAFAIERGHVTWIAAKFVGLGQGGYRKTTAKARPAPAPGVVPTYV
jgi:hypothetical protein